MPLHDYKCPDCDEWAVDQYRSVLEGAQERPPACPFCGHAMEWVPQVGFMDAFEPGQEFQIYDGQNRPVTVESMAQMHKIERESEQQARNGEGQPLRFRALHQNRGNMLDNTFGEPNQHPDPLAKRRFGLRGGAKPVASEPDHAFGPGVSETNCSALKD